MRAAVKKIGYPVIIKPIAGAGSMDTYRVDNAEELKAAIAKIGHIDHVNVEEFIDGEEYTYDTICIDGKIVYTNIGYYRPRPLIARSEEWISPQTLCLRDLDAPELAGRTRDGTRSDRSAELQDRLHSHGVVPGSPMAKSCSAKSLRVPPARARSI